MMNPGDMIAPPKPASDRTTSPASGAAPRASDATAASPESGGELAAKAGNASLEFSQLVNAAPPSDTTAQDPTALSDGADPTAAATAAPSAPSAQDASPVFAEIPNPLASPESDESRIADLAIVDQAAGKPMTAVNDEALETISAERQVERAGQNPEQAIGDRKIAAPEMVAAPTAEVRQSPAAQSVENGTSIAVAPPPDSRSKVEQAWPNVVFSRQSKTSSETPPPPQPITTSADYTKLNAAPAKAQPPKTAPAVFFGAEMSQADFGATLRDNASRIASSELIPQAKISTISGQAERGAATATSVTAQVAAAVLRNSGDSFEIRLVPVELGKVSMTLSMVDDVMVAHVNAERPEVLDMLRRNGDLLARELGENGYEQVNVEFAERGFAQKENSFDDDVASLIETDEHPDAATALQSHTVINLSGRLDIKL